MLLSIVLLRCSFVPLFLLCNVGSDQRELQVVFHNDFFPIFFVTLFGLSNGYFGSLAMIAAPK